MLDPRHLTEVTCADLTVNLLKPPCRFVSTT
jgi:hypothetical protein